MAVGFLEGSSIRTQYFFNQKMLFLLLFITVSCTLRKVKRSPENFLHKHDKNMEKYVAKYESAKKKFDQEKDPLVILIWWAPEYPLLKKVKSRCG